MMYCYDLHVHSGSCSACGKSTPSEMVDAFHAAGYDGFVLTDHFLRGNTAVDVRLPWNVKIKKYYDAYLEAAAAAEKYNMTVMFGIEHNYGGGREVLTYNIDDKFLYKYPDLCAVSINEYAERVRACGGFLSAAHPFRAKSYITYSALPSLTCFDAFEVFNKGNEDGWNDKAVLEAVRNNITQLSGSDAHNAAKVMMYAGIATETKLKDSADLVRVIKSKAYKLIVKGEIIDFYK